MITNAAVTLFHRTYDPQTRQAGWKRSFFPQVSWYAGLGAVAADNGIRYEDQIKVRIPTDAELTLAVGDKLVQGESALETPPPEAFTVMGFSDNRRGSAAVWHWRVTAK